MSVIETFNLSLGYKKHVIVTNINLNIQRGEFIAILGPNGAGKSTFLQSLLGIVKPIAGEILILNEKPGCHNHQIGYMPQARHHTSIANLTSRAMLEAVYDGIRFGISFESKIKNEEIARVLHLVKAENLANKPIRQLSGGEKQRIHLAQALLGTPQILLLDEPLSNLDPHFQEIFIHILEEIKNQLKVTILLTAHDPNPLLHVLSRVLFFAKGKFLIGKADEIMTSERLSMLYDTPIDVIQYHNRLYVLGDGHDILGQGAHHHD
ncbi:MAG TPA: metal ABC transporter ATP-binding protein [Gammaproteobacteria bacterium]|jgi:zinc/manganese transport system ATP-binding protein|nr:metal ABC transporter ATP-binding protein [Gammaproteobacteria bacterium]